ncbi:flavin reductase family protein [Actinomadura hibisca]|uniref:flavin reductase family protein n=1 Tax=Actinomadura hibisca TaxID=68565 RepID=UPI000829FFAC|nr:flavin reductase family protein [Actinomadura hibisca]
MRTVCGSFPTGVTVITSGGERTDAATTVNSFTSVSLEPPLVLFCLHRGSRLRGPLEESGSFVVDFLTHRQEQVAWRFAGRESAHLSEVPHHRTPNGLPVLTEALVFLECRVADEYDGGDHTIVLGEVIGLGTSAEEVDPLVFYRGGMRVLGAAGPEPVDV